MCDNSHPSPPEERTVYVANFKDDVDEDLLEELFTQAGPVVKVVRRETKDSNAKFALVEFEDESSVLFAIEIMNGVRLYHQDLLVKPRTGTKQEELYKRKRGEIEERQRISQDRGVPRRESYDNNRRESREFRDYDRSRDDSHWGADDRYRNESTSAGRDSGRWRNSRMDDRARHATPTMLPHHHFVNQMLQQQQAKSAQTYNEFHRRPFSPTPPSHVHHPYHTPHRHQDRRGSDRSSAIHHNNNRYANNRRSARY